MRAGKAHRGPPRPVTATGRDGERACLGPTPTGAIDALALGSGALCPPASARITFLRWQPLGVRQASKSRGIVYEGIRGETIEQGKRQEQGWHGLGQPGVAVKVIDPRGNEAMAVKDLP